MEYDKVEKIGKVLIKQIKVCETNKPVYSDGPVEKELYEGFKADPNYGTISDGQRYPSWAHEYHLSPVRHNLLKWYPFDPNGTVLEVGAGCGALTGLLCQKFNKVTALEYSRQRAMVTAMRHSQYSNLDVVVGGLQDFESDEKFDCITVIGVLEYAGEFYGGEKPHEFFLAKLHGMLKPEGTLHLAIENKIGLKYLCGAPEDHTGRVFDSIYDYPSSKVKTYSKKELIDLLHLVGFSKLEWYYPLPDYKRPKAVLSEEIIPNDVDSVWTLYPVRTNGLLYRTVLEERWVGKTLAHAGLFGEFSNSFLVTAKKIISLSHEPRCIRFWGSNELRKHEFRTNMRICVDDGKKYFIKSAYNDKSIPFIGEIARRESLAEKFFSNKAEVVKSRPIDSSLCYNFIELPSLDELISNAIGENATAFGKSILQEYKHFLETLPWKECIPEKFMQEFCLPSGHITRPIKCLTHAPFDCVPHNIKVGSRKWYIIDNEWTFDYPLPIDYLLFRGILTLIINLQSHIKIHSSKDQPVTLFWGYGSNREYIPLSWLEILQELQFPVNTLIHWESKFQNYVNLYQKKYHLRLGKNPKVVTHVKLCNIPTTWKIYHRLWRIFSNRAKYFRHTL